MAFRWSFGDGFGQCAVGRPGRKNGRKGEGKCFGTRSIVCGVVSADDSSVYIARRRLCINKVFVL